MEYKISVDYDDYFANSSQICAKNIEVVGDSIMFLTDQAGLDLLDKNNVSYMLHSDKKKERKKFAISKLGIMVGLFVIVFLVFINSYRVSSVQFNGQYPINDTIETYIKSQNQTLLCFDFHKNNYQSLAKDLRSVFAEYEWISIHKKGSVVYVDIEPTTAKKPDYDTSYNGDIVATKNGVVMSFVCFNGTTVLKQNDYVTAGEILISGNLDTNTCARGYVLATTYEECTIKVAKQIYKEEYSGQSRKHYTGKLIQWEFPFGKANHYDFYNLEQKTVFNIPYIFSVKRQIEYEKKVLELNYSEEEAIAYAKSLIEKDFERVRKLEEEKIERMEALLVKKEDNHYEITFLVKKIESIGQIKKHSES